MAPSVLTKCSHLVGHVDYVDKNARFVGSKYSRIPVTRPLKGNEKQFELRGIRVIEVNFSEFEILIKGKEI